MWTRLGLLICAQLALVYSINILIFGDSVDRQTVIEWCALQTKMGVQNITQTIWGGPSLKYNGGKQGRMPSLICQISPNTSIAFLHTFGSKAHGPYLNWLMNNDDDPYVDTVARLKHAFEIYEKLFGLPDSIFLHFASWDVQQIVREIPENLPEATVSSRAYWRGRVETFERNMKERIAQIRNLTRGQVDIGLRTGAWTKSGLFLMHLFNEVIRRLALIEDLTLFDLDEDIWSSVDYDYSLEPIMFRDFIHPLPHYSAIAGEKMVGFQFSGYVKYKHMQFTRQWEHRFQHFYAEGSNGRTVVNLVRKLDGEVVYYFNKRNHSLHAGVYSEVMKVMRMNDGDILHMNVEPSSVIPLGLPMPQNLTAKSIVKFGNYEDSSVVIQENSLRRLPSQAVAHDLEVFFNTSAVKVDPLFLDCFTHLSFHHNVSTNFNSSEGTLVRLSTDRTIYVIKHGHREAVPSMQALMAMGKDLGDVHVYSHVEDIELVPLLQ